ncbi:MAG TPA: hypothetical protein VGI58_19870 [Streptosporangiaceae bacterium]
MTSPPIDVAGCVAGYAARLHGVIGSGHHVASPLGAWLLLALAAPAATGGDRDALTVVLGCESDAAARVAADLLANPHPLVASAAAVWTQRGVEGGERFRQWQAWLPAAVTTGELPGQAALDGWARDHTFGLIRHFPVQLDPSMYLVLASALATKVSWQVPFQLADAASLGQSSPFAGQVSQVLRTPSPPERRGHVQFVAAGGTAGDVIVHAASAADGVVVVSVAAQPDVPSAQVLALAHDLGHRQVTGQSLDRRSLADLPLGTGPLWLVREVSAAADTCIAVLPAWSAESAHSLTDPVLGFAAAKHALVDGPDPWTATQSAMARYSRTGFEAAAVTALAVAASARLPSKRRAAELRFAHPYAVVAFAADAAGHGGGSGQPSPWHGLPVFSAWVARPDEATDDESGG